MLTQNTVPSSDLEAMHVGDPEYLVAAYVGLRNERLHPNHFQRSRLVAGQLCSAPLRLKAFQSIPQNIPELPLAPFHLPREKFDMRQNAVLAVSYFDNLLEDNSLADLTGTRARLKDSQGSGNLPMYRREARGQRAPRLAHCFHRTTFEHS